MIQNHDLVKHKKNLQRNYPYSYLTCVAMAFCFMSIRSSAFTICSENIRSPNQSVAPMIFYIWFQYLNCVIQCFIQRTNDQLLWWYLTFDSMFELWHLIKCSGGILHSIQKLELCHPMYFSQNQQLLTTMIEQGQNRNW